MSGLPPQADMGARLWVHALVLSERVNRRERLPIPSQAVAVRRDRDGAPRYIYVRIRSDNRFDLSQRICCDGWLNVGSMPWITTSHATSVQRSDAHSHKTRVTSYHARLATGFWRSIARFAWRRSTLLRRMTLNRMVSSTRRCGNPCCGLAVYREAKRS
jgi:hypothetical protein